MTHQCWSGGALLARQAGLARAGEALGQPAAICVLQGKARHNIPRIAHTANRAPLLLLLDQGSVSRVHKVSTRQAMHHLPVPRAKLGATPTSTVWRIAKLADPVALLALLRTRARHVLRAKAHAVPSHKPSAFLV